MRPVYPENPRGYGTARAPLEKSDLARYSAQDLIRFRKAQVQ